MTKSYSKAVKNAAVNQVISGISVARVACNIGCAVTTIYKWIRAAGYNIPSEQVVQTTITQMPIKIDVLKAESEFTSTAQLQAKLQKAIEERDFFKKMAFELFTPENISKQLAA